MRNNYPRQNVPSGGYSGYSGGGIPSGRMSHSNDLSLDDGKLKKYLKITLIISSVVGILCAILIFATLFNVNIPYKTFFTLTKLGIIAGVSAFICGIYTIIDLIRGRKEF